MRDDTTINDNDDNTHRMTIWTRDCACPPSFAFIPLFRPTPPPLCPCCVHWNSSDNNFHSFTQFNATQRWHCELFHHFNRYLDTFGCVMYM